MDLRIKIEEDYKQSIRNKDQNRINTLRLIKSAIKDKQISLRGKTDNLSDSDILNLLQSLVKQRKDSIEAFTKANRQDLIDNEKAEIDIIEMFLPEQKSDDEVIEIIKNIVKENNLSSIKDMGVLMNIIRSKYIGVIDLGVAGKIAKSILVK